MRRNALGAVSKPGFTGGSRLRRTIYIATHNPSAGKVEHPINSYGPTFSSRGISVSGLAERPHRKTTLSTAYLPGHFRLAIYPFCEVRHRYPVIVYSPGRRRSENKLQLPPETDSVAPQGCSGGEDE